MKNTIPKSAASAGVKSESTAWKATMLTVIPPTPAYNFRKYLFKSEVITRKIILKKYIYLVLKIILNLLRLYSLLNFFM